MKLEILDVAEGLKLQRNTAQPEYHGADCPYDHVLYVVSGYGLQAVNPQSGWKSSAKILLLPKSKISHNFIP